MESLASCTATDAYGAILWWELRQALFNVAVIVTGAASLVATQVMTGRYGEPGHDPNEQVLVWLCGACFIIAANAFYTVGSVMDLMWSEGDTLRTQAICTSVQRRGMRLSLAVAVVPGVVALTAGLVVTFR